MKNIEDRLHAAYGDRSSLALRRLDDHAWEVTIALPYHADGNGNGSANGKINGNGTAHL